MSNIFRAYDIRGIYPNELNEQVAFKIGQAAAVFLKSKTMVVGEDARKSSPALSKKIKEGIVSAGCNVLSVGMCTTPLFYFSVNKLNADGGIMVTASHNPAQFNGFKVVGREAVPISSDNGLLAIQRLSDSYVPSNSTIGLVTETSVLEDYVNFLASQSKVNNLKIVIDASNGVAPTVLNSLFEKIKFNIISINFDIDGTFPNHSSDISKEENLKYLRNKVLKTNADIGFAFDGDADRLTVIDEKGNKIGPEFVVGLMFNAMSGWLKKPKVAYDLRFSRSIKELIGKNGLPSRTGYAFVRKTMREAGADFGGELAGHFDFKEMNYAESAILAMLRVIEIVTKEKKSLSQIVKPLLKYFNSGEINIDIQDREKALVNIKSRYLDGTIDEMDGIMVEYKNWWFNVRTSNTEPIIRLVVEADTKELMDEKKKELIQVLSSF